MIDEHLLMKRQAATATADYDDTAGNSNEARKASATNGTTTTVSTSFFITAT